MTDRSSAGSFDTMTGAEVFVYEIEALRAGDAAAARAARAHLDAPAIESRPPVTEFDVVADQTALPARNRGGEIASVTTEPVRRVP